MKNRIIIPLAALALLILSSCGTGKKLEAAEAQVSQLKSQNADLTNTVNSLQQQVSDLKSNVASLTSNREAMVKQFNDYKANCEETEAKLSAVREVVDQQYATMQEVEKKIEAALANFESKGVEVYYRNGLVYVRMQDQLLYKSGSSALGKDGKAALASLASVLNDYPKLKVIVVGNTDSVQFRKGGGNWHLSTERANGVVKTLRDDYSVDPSRLTAAGKSKYDPVADNSTPEGRARNRRTDIILNPDLDRLWQSAQSQ